jgi:hypothetical protein
MPPENYYELLKNNILKLSDSDKNELLESVFVGMTTAMSLYYRELGHSDREISVQVDREVANLRDLINERLASDEHVVADLVDKYKAKEDVEVEPVELEPTDDQFENDATIDMHLIMDAVLKSQ